MKTYHIKDLLKKDVLIIELPEGTYHFPKDTDLVIVNKDKASLPIHFPKGYTLLGKPEEIREEDAKELVEYLGNIVDFLGIPSDMWKYYGANYDATHTATEALLSAIESVIFWDVNPFGEPKLPPFVNPNKKDFSGNDVVDFKYEEYQFLEAEQKTFDRNRSVILKKELTPKIQ